ncbi:hypothetical protein OSB04_028568 [Centaurea solstitialis]|uniref:Hybrid signal transduction histidine kinase M n=1 Tax=Centaurea solstitialis TaxID=347529 RepID=A0AA38VXV8_9ASTR|nr:hypothetical protein OSB04_028568 [Centaurea solstitialis]
MAPTDPPNPPNKAYGINNIRTFVPLTLDFDKLNYDAWSELFTTHCNAFDVIDHIDTTTPKPTDDEWKKVDSVVKLWIYGTISQALLQTVLKKDATALQVWTTLENLFRENKDARCMQLDTELRNIVMGDLSVNAYCTKVKSLADLVANLDPASAIPDKHLVMYTVNGLSPKYESVANIIRYRSPLPTTYSTLRIPPIVPHSDHSSSPHALLSGQPAPSRNPSRRNDRRRTDQQSNRRRSQNPGSGFTTGSHFVPQQPSPPGPVFSSRNHSGNQPSGWVYFPPATDAGYRQQVTRSPAPSSSPGLLGAAPSSHPQAHITGPVTPNFAASPPWAWTTPDQPTALP